MSTALRIADSQVSFTLAGRRWPFVSKRVPDPPPAFAGLPETLIGRLPLKAVKPAGGLFQDYAESHRALGALRQQLDTLLAAVSVAGGFEPAFALPEPEPTPPGTAELAAKPPELILRHMQDHLRRLAVRAVTDFAASLDEMVNEEQVGLITWAGPAACCYHYFEFSDVTAVTDETTKVDHRTVGRKHRVTTTTATARERVRTLTRHVHDLVEAKAHALTGPVRRPRRVQELIKAIPDWLAPLCTLVDGQQVRDLRISRELARESWVDEEHEVAEWEEPEPVVAPSPPVYRYDPALVLGDLYVLAGWTAEETKADPYRPPCPECQFRIPPLDYREYRYLAHAEAARWESVGGRYRCRACRGSGYKE